MSKHTPSIDFYGSLLSLCCAIHCIVMPMALMLFTPWLATVFRQETPHLVLVGASVALAAWAFWRGKRKHGKAWLLWFAVAAAVLIVVGELFLNAAPWYHAVISASAGLALAFGHSLNLKYCASHDCDCPSK